MLSALAPVVEAHAGLVCRAQHLAPGSGTSVWLARLNAVANWHGDVAARYGDAWSVWNTARNPIISCGPHGGSWFCAARAEPCRELAAQTDRPLLAAPRRDPSVKVSVNVPATALEKPIRAILVLLPGGHGRIALTSGAPSVATQLAGNFLVRMRYDLMAGSFITVLVDAANDLQSAPFLFGNYRRSQPHAEDVAAVITSLQREYGTLPVFVLGMSAGTTGAANAAHRLGPPLVKGVALLSSVTQSNTQGIAWLADLLPPGGLNAVPVGEIALPVLFVHHDSDECAPFTPYAGVTSLVTALQSMQPPRDATLETITGGTGQADPVPPPETPSACDSGLGHHSFEGAEAAAVSRVVAWINARLP